MRIAALSFALLVLGCWTVPEQAKIELGKEIDCATAGRDLALLESERASVLARIENGVGAVEPAEAVLSLIGGTEEEKISVATGEYNDRIDAKMAEIRETCGIEE